MSAADILLARLKASASTPKQRASVERAIAAAAAPDVASYTERLAMAHELIDIRESMARAKAEKEKKDEEPPVKLEEVKRRLKGIVDDEDEVEEERDKARRALRAIENSEKDAKARASYARLDAHERELLARTSPTVSPESYAFRQTGGALIAPERFPSVEQARARVDELGVELARLDRGRR